MVGGRQWNLTRGFVESGQVLSYGNWREHSGAPVQPIHYGVRSDVVQEIDRQADLLVVDANQPTNKRWIGNYLNRPTDVSHFWPKEGQGDKDVQRGERSRLRDAVSTHLASLPYHIFVGVTGQAKDSGRNEVQKTYVTQMLASKIIVVSQKDGWEDHYRLMEALVSGALVMTDPMLLLPDGLRDGESLVVYRSLQDPSEKIEYYLKSESERLKIAQNGFNVAMGQYRSWHMMERIVDGLIKDNRKMPWQAPP